MNQICIAKKVSHQNVEFLDFAVNDLDQLIVFNSFKDASEFLKSEVGTGEQLLDYIITTTEAQSNNPAMVEILARGVQNMSNVPVEELQQASKQIAEPTADQFTEDESEVELMFVFKATDYEVVNHQKIYDKKHNRTLVPVIAFVDEKDSSRPADVDTFKLVTVFVDKSESENA
jgi:hypothetical protein